MDEQVRKLKMIQVEATIRNLRKHNFTADYIDTKEELIDFLSNQIASESIVASGGSMTLKQAGVIDMLKNREDIKYLARENYADPEVGFHEALNADYYLMSSNAVTGDGMLYNVDGHGNRIAALIYGPKKVFVVVGLNKIVKDLDEAKKRVEELAAPANCIRLNKSNPCTTSGFCVHCNTESTICNQYLVTRRSRQQERIHVLIVGDEFGY